MKDLFNKAKEKASQLAADLRPDASDVKHVADRAVDLATKTANEVGRLGKGALKTDLAKDAAAGAAIGAVVAVPVPVIGPMAGAVIGAGLGVYKNITHPRTTGSALPNSVPSSPVNVIEATAAEEAASDRYEELTKLHDLKVKGVLTDEEFASEKKKILDR